MNDLIATGAAYRLARLVHSDEITVKIRSNWLFDRLPPRSTHFAPFPGQPNVPPTTWMVRRGPNGTLTPRPSVLDRVVTLPRPGWAQDVDGSWYHAEGTFGGKLVSCPWCVTVWTGLVVAALRRPRAWRHPLRTIIEGLGLAAGALVWWRQIDGNGGLTVAHKDAK